MNLRRIGFGRLALGAVGALLVAAPIALAAQSEDRRRAVGDWLVEDVWSDYGRTVRISREEGDYSLDYHMFVRPGASEVDSHGYLIWRLTCGQGGDESLEGGRGAEQAARVRAQLADYLARCETPAAEAATLLSGFDRAYLLASSWADERVAELASMDANAMYLGDDLDAMANAVDAAAYAAEADMNAYGEDMSMDMDMNLVDMNVTTDTNITYGEDMDANWSEEAAPN